MTKKFDLNKVRRIQQGDVIFERVDTIPPEVLEKGKKITGNITLALGEATGHSHTVVETAPGTVTSYQFNDLTFVVADEEAIAQHNTHGPAPLATGTIWKVAADGETGSLLEVDHFRDEVVALRD